MTKKIYESPNMEIVEVELESTVLADSVTTGFGVSSLTGGLDL